MSHHTDVGGRVAGSNASDSTEIYAEGLRIAPLKLYDRGRPNDTLFVKRFPTYPDRVYNEAAGLTLSVWYPTGPRIELEPIGPRERLKPGESASFTEDWWLLPHPFPRKGQQVDLKALAEQVEKQTAKTK